MTTEQFQIKRWEVDSIMSPGTAEVRITVSIGDRDVRAEKAYWLDGSIYRTVNWSLFGAVTPADARTYAAAILEAARLIEEE